VTDGGAVSVLVQLCLFMVLGSMLLVGVSWMRDVIEHG
jgi:hypothetical protein